MFPILLKYYFASYLKGYTNATLSAPWKIRPNLEIVSIAMYGSVAYKMATYKIRQHPLFTFTSTKFSTYYDGPLLLPLRCE